MKEKNIQELAKRMGLVTVEDMCQYTITQLVVKIANKVNELVDEVWRFETDVQEILKTQNENIQYLLGEGLHLEVENIFDGWVQDGTFDTLLNQSALKKVNDRIDETNAQLSNINSQILFFDEIKNDDNTFIENLNIAVSLLKTKKCYRSIVFESEEFLSDHITLSDLMNIDFVFLKNVESESCKRKHILFSNCENLKIRGASFKNVSLEFTDVNFLEISGVSLSIDGDMETDISGICFYDNCNDIKIERCSFSTPNGIKGYVPHDSTKQGKNVEITNCLFETTRMGIENFNCFNNVKVEKCCFKNSLGFSALSFVGDSIKDVYISENTFLDTADITGTNIYLELTVENVRVYSNLFHDINSFSCISSHTSGSVFFYDNKVENCKCTKPMFRKSGKEFYIHNNKFIINDNITLLGSPAGGTFSENSIFSFKNNTIDFNVKCDTFLTLSGNTEFAFNTISYNGTEKRPLVRLGGKIKSFHGNFVSGNFTYVIQSSDENTECLFSNNIFDNFQKWTWDGVIPNGIREYGNVIIEP